MDMKGLPVSGHSEGLLGAFKGKHFTSAVGTEQQTVLLS